MSALEQERTRVQIDAMTHLAEEHVPRAKRYRDYREMLDKEKGIDAVIVATPDHMHASIALAAMDFGKHVYVQKPLTWSIAEARQLSKRARETRLATQMGNQGHSWDDARKAVEYVWAGAIGEVASDPHLDESSARLLAAGNSASRCDARRRAAALERTRRHYPPRERDGRHVPGP